MDEPRAQRTLVKSPPELWAEVSDADALAGHLGEFGEIRITRAEPETTVAWEGDRARGTVELEPTAWGTKVTLTAEMAEVEEHDPAGQDEEDEDQAAEDGVEPEADRVAAPEAEAPATPEPEPAASVSPEPEPAAQRRGLLARLFGRRAAEPVAPSEPAPAPEPPPPAPAPPVEIAVPAETPPDPCAAKAPTAPLRPDRAQEILSAVLDDLGSAHHRPFSR